MNTLISAIVKIVVEALIEKSKPDPIIMLINEDDKTASVFNNKSKKRRDKEVSELIPNIYF